MSKGRSFAKEEVMHEYLDGLLVDLADPVEATHRVAKLLEKATVPDVIEEKTPAIEVPTPEVSVEAPAPESHIVDEQTKEADKAAEIANIESETSVKVALQERLENRFQALFFDVAGLTMAVPLIDLGGIHQIDKIGPLFGKPDWFMGVMLHREEKISVVDAAKWVMPEKYTQIDEDKLHYKYIIMLSESEWGLSSNALINTVELDKQDVKWREADGKRPWLAGMVKERMCALIDVKQLIDLLNAGLDSNQK
ncbi:chemotaxis protein CheW [Alteromonas facilis]|uniref:chemotaxis protein CheW n=1 Tax=Alteromonas facilis TaxID=2048004 RepID=UPI000C289A17|nr:chemotaxis protein CheW [Alteromonas facilis]